MVQIVQFTLNVNPCLTTSYTTQSVIQPVNYSLGDPTFAFGSYRFEQSPACGYSEVVQLTGLPSFVTHNAASRSFMLTKTEDFAFVQTF